MDRLVDLQSLRFGQPEYLWLLIAPAALGALWAWRSIQRAGDARAHRTTRLVPVVERIGAGDSPFWLGLIAALALAVLALARPQAVTAIVQSPGADLVLLVDGSASMRVQDMGTDRWGRAMAWVRALTRTLSWNGDRLALATFAHVAVPQVRLTRDPNTVLFFLDYLEGQPTFALDQDPAWDTNIEDAVYWGIRLLDADQRRHGPSRNARTFVLLSDGQVWSGQVERALAEASRWGVAVDVIGVGTTAGGFVPVPRGPDGQVLPGFERSRSVLDRESLRAIARAGGGRYYELGSVSDTQLAARILDEAGRRSSNEQVGESFRELYWHVAVAAAACLGLGMLFVRQTMPLVLQVAVALGTIALVGSVRP
jgi:Ca-activated chloride channel family protein